MEYGASVLSVTNNMKVVDISNEIWMDQGQPSYTSLPAIAFWVRSRVGAINNLLYEDFSFDVNTDEILDGNGNEVTMMAASILKQMYKVYDYEVQIRNLMNALINDTVMMAEDNGIVIKRINRNEMAKTLVSLKKQEEEYLEKLITTYRVRSAVPAAIAGDDTTEAWYSPQYFYFRR